MNKKGNYSGIYFLYKVYTSDIKVEDIMSFFNHISGINNNTAAKLSSEKLKTNDNESSPFDFCLGVDDSENIENNNKLQTELQYYEDLIDDNDYLEG